MDECGDDEVAVCELCRYADRQENGPDSRYGVTAGEERAARAGRYGEWIP